MHHIPRVSSGVFPSDSAVYFASLSTAVQSMKRKVNEADDNERSPLTKRQHLKTADGEISLPTTQMGSQHDAQRQTGSVRQTNDPTSGKAFSEPLSQTAAATVPKEFSHVHTVEKHQEHEQMPTHSLDSVEAVADGPAEDEGEAGYVLDEPDSSKHYVAGPARMLWTDIEHGQKGLCLVMTMELSEKTKGAIQGARVLHLVESDIQRERDDLVARDGVIVAEVSDLRDRYESRRAEMEDENVAQAECDALLADFEKQSQDLADERERNKQRMDRLDYENKHAMSKFREDAERAIWVLEDVFKKSRIFFWDRPFDSRAQSEESTRRASNDQLSISRSKQEPVRLLTTAANVPERNSTEVEDAEATRESLEDALNQAKDRAQAAWHHVNEVQSKLNVHQHNIESQERRYIDSQVNRDHLDLKAEFDVTHLAESMRLSQKLTQAQNQLKELDAEVNRLVAQIHGAGASSSCGSGDMYDYGYNPSDYGGFTDSPNRKPILRYLRAVEEVNNPHTCSVQDVDLDDWDQRSNDPFDDSISVVHDRPSLEARARIPEWQEKNTELITHWMETQPEVIPDMEGPKRGPDAPRCGECCLEYGCRRCDVQAGGFVVLSRDRYLDLLKQVEKYQASMEKK